MGIVILPHNGRFLLLGRRTCLSWYREGSVSSLLIFTISGLFVTMSLQQRLRLAPESIRAGKVLPLTWIFTKFSYKGRVFTGTFFGHPCSPMGLFALKCGAVSFPDLRNWRVRYRREDIGEHLQDKSWDLADVAYLALPGISCKHLLLFSSYIL